MKQTAIEWTDATWNPVSGCSKISTGCKNCYAESIAHRFAGSKGYPNGFKVTLHPERVAWPMHWKGSKEARAAGRPSRIFVNSMSDLFHEDVPDSFILDVWKVMKLSPNHTFQILTKRPERMLEFLTGRASAKKRGIPESKPMLPLPNVWLGVSVENQAAADVRVPLLLQTPAAVRFLSCEPLLGPVDLTQMDQTSESDPGYNALMLKDGDEGTLMTTIDWVICGGESGPDARPMHPDWARSLRDQCKEAEVPFFFKQWGEWAPGECADLAQTRTERVAWYQNEKWIYGTVTPKQGAEMHHDDGPDVWRLVKYPAGRGLDGKEHNEMPVPVIRCVKCGCTDKDCRQCIEKTGEPCGWVIPKYCSACFVYDRFGALIERPE